MNTLFSKSFQFGNPVERQFVNTRNVFQKAKLIKFQHIGCSETPDVHGILTHKMNDPFDNLGGTINIYAAKHGFVRHTYQFVAAGRTMCWENNFLFPAGPKFDKRLYNIWDHVPGTFHEYSISNAQVLLFYHIFIKKGNGSYSDSANGDRFDLCHRGDTAGAPY